MPEDEEMVTIQLKATDCQYILSCAEDCDTGDALDIVYTVADAIETAGTLVQIE